MEPLSERSSSFGKELQFQQHPNVAKFTPGGKERVVGLKDPERGFPVGQGLGVLRWRLSTKDESVVPLTSKFEVYTLFLPSLRDSFVNNQVNWMLITFVS